MLLVPFFYDTILLIFFLGSIQRWYGGHGQNIEHCFASNYGRRAMDESASGLILCHEKTIAMCIL
jgi:hypothetical protein